jgi:transglutaminase-like putative cysteine protease
VSLLAAVKRANLPGPPENSIVFRVAATAAVVVSLAACWSQQELSAMVTVGAIVLVILGNLFSYVRRARPLGWLKLLLAGAVMAGFVWFFATVTTHATIGDLASVEGPLAVLFAWIQVTHAFDVPSRRDLGFSLAGSATLMAVAGAQAIDTAFGLYVVVWAAFGLTGLLAMWTSMAGGAPIRGRAVVVSVLAVLVVAVGVVALVPAPHAASTVIFPTALAGDVPVGSPGGLVGNGPAGTEPLHAASPGGQTRVGGFLGFAGPLDTAVRGTLGNEVVMRVRADRPTFWLAETFNQWNGQSWTEYTPPGSAEFRPVSPGPPFALTAPVGNPPAGGADFQTFYIEQTGANLVFHADNAAQVWFPSHRMFVADDGTMRAGTTIGTGTVYTVESLVDRPSPAALAAASLARAGEPLPLPSTPIGRLLHQSLQLPQPYARAHALAVAVTKGATSTYQKVVALEDWIGANTRYTTDIPPLQPGQDTVDEFLFGNRRGYCEQISTALAVMLRSLGVPAREAVGYVPGPYNPLTDLYDVQARDAHAWVQVWFPTYGWQNFDPTAFVPLANPTPASALAHDTADALRRIPLAPVVVVGGLGALATMGERRWRSRPRSWAESVSRQILSAADRAHLTVAPTDTIAQVAAALERRWRTHDPPLEPPPAPGPVALARAAEQAAYGGRAPDRDRQRELRRAARALRRRAHRLRPRRAEKPARRPQAAPAPTAASHEVPAASSGR